MKNALNGNIGLTTDAYAREYRSGKMEDVGDNPNIQ